LTTTTDGGNRPTTNAGAEPTDVYERTRRQSQGLPPCDDATLNDDARQRCKTTTSTTTAHDEDCERLYERTRRQSLETAAV
jgi:hypothetical protein